MKKDVVYLLKDGDDLQVFGNLKTLAESILSSNQYSTIWRGLDAGKGIYKYGDYVILRRTVIRATFRK